MSSEGVVRPKELPEVLAALPAAVRVLTLDCFDTILWRNVASPADVFYSLQHAQTHRRARMSAKLRVQMEGRARETARLRKSTPEITLREVYEEAFSQLPPDELDAMVESEIEAEKSACFAHPSTVALMRAAAAKGLRIVVVSDTYFSEAQLRALLGHALPEDVMAHVAHVFCSSEARVNKASGLFERVLKTLKAKPGELLHIGDHPVADFLAPRALGIHALHLRHHDPHVAEVLRLEESTLSMLDASARQQFPMLAPFRGVLAEKKDFSSPAEAFGYVATGPLLYSFGRFVLEELEALRAEGKRCKAAFLMRDAYLPRLVCEAIAARAVGPEVNVSRFVAYAASFRTQADIEDYLIRFATSKRFADLTRQLLLPKGVADGIIHAAEKHKEPAAEFVRLVQREPVIAQIIERSRAYRQRFYKSLDRALGLERGDTLVMIDLGYEGTAQRLLEPVLREERGIEVVGRYLLVGETPGWHKSRKGLIDASWCDERASTALVHHIALLENVCTKDQGSVVDFEEDGTPILSENKVSRAQVMRVEPVQQAALAFARDARDYFERAGHAPSRKALEQTAIASLGRLLYMPTAKEIAYIEGFRLDLNMGTSDTFALFDREQGLTGLRRRGLFFMETKSQAARMNYPIELRHAGLELAVTMLAFDRFRLNASYQDFSLRHEELPCFVVRGDGATATTITARSTHDGFFSLIVPMGEGDFDVGLNVGAVYAWLQVESVSLIPESALLQDDEAERAIDYSEHVTLDAVSDHGHGMLACTDPNALLFLRGPGNLGARHVCRIVYRPLARSDAASASRAGKETP